MLPIIAVVHRLGYHFTLVDSAWSPDGKLNVVTGADSGMTNSGVVMLQAHGGRK
jgi:hypothetical protein